MKYIVIKGNEKNATHKNPGNELFVITEVSDTAKVESNHALVLDDISGYQPLQSYVTKMAKELEDAKNDAVDVLNSKLAKKLNTAGVVVNGITLGATDSDRTAFSQAISLLGTAESLAPDAGAFGAAMVSVVFGRGITDISGVVHDMTVNDFKTLMLGYGQAIGAAESETLTKVAQVRAASTTEEIDAIVDKKKKKN